MLIGDWFVLRRFGNVTTAVMEACFITCCEPFIHTYMTENLEEERFEEQEASPATGQLQTDFAEESDSKTLTDDKENHYDR